MFEILKKESREINKKVFSVDRPKSISSYSLGKAEDALLKGWIKKWGDTDFQEFKEYLISSFSFSCIHADINRDFNFWGKKRVVRLFRFLIIAQFVYICILAILFSSPVWIYLINLFFNKKHSITALLNSIPHEGGLLLAIEATLLSAFAITFIAKNTWLNVKKYQETWARHRLTQYRMSHEMLRFLSQTEPYTGTNTEQNKRLFIGRILLILDDDMQAFSKNLTEKEASVIADFLSIHSSSSKQND